MSINYAKLFNRRVTPQTQPIPGSSQVRNSNSGYSWQTGDQPADRKIRIEMTRTTANGGLRITNLTSSQPGGNRAAGMNIGYSISTAAKVEIRVVTTSGTQVRRISSNSTRAAGANQADWELKNEQGVAMPAGAYIVEIKAQLPDGKQTVRGTVPVLVTR